jgi:putative (di)nucleoside polyphosphate hydrolase
MGKSNLSKLERQFKISMKNKANIKKNIGIYRKNVGFILQNNNKEILVGKRYGSAASSWQMPQGGILENEIEEDALSREVYEEIGLAVNSYKIIQKSEGYYYYTIPEHMRKSIWQNLYIGQKQRWFLANFTGEDSDININGAFPEFEEWKWCKPSEVLLQAISFKQNVYHAIFSDFKLI